MRYDLNNILVISISGRASTGKTTCANMLAKYLSFTERYLAHVCSFARGVKETAKFMGWDGEKDIPGRQLLQEIGKAGREYNENLWVEQLLDSLEPNTYPEIIIIDDWRFPNELDYLRKLSGFEVFTIRISAPNRESLKGTTAYNDLSETSLPDTNPNYYNYNVDNTGSMEKLNNTSIDIAKDILVHASKWGKEKENK